jgi:saccharopine dehydrogenase-like NADP-dependent oxidoreductase
MVILFYNPFLKNPYLYRIYKFSDKSQPYIFMDKKYDIVLLGATGFTGKLIAEYLQKHQKEENISLAFAGRNAQKLEQDLSGIPLEGISVEICDIQDPEQLTALTKNTKILMNAVGPFSFTGRQVIEAVFKTKPIISISPANRHLYPMFMSDIMRLLLKPAFVSSIVVVLTAFLPTLRHG